MIISWSTTNACDLNCPHCYRDAGKAAPNELTTSEAKTLLEQISEAGFKIMIFSGGEPLLRKDIFELVEYAAGQGLRPVFGTNGILLTRETVQRLKDSGAVAMGISLDSTDPEKHDSFRGIPGSFDKTVNGMKNCKEAGLRFQIHTTVMDWNYDEIEQVTDLAVELGASAHHIFFLVPTGRAAHLASGIMNAKKYEELLERIIDRQNEVPIELKPTCAPQFMRIAKQKGIKMRFTRGCIAGITYCLIGPTGDVQPCAYLDMKLGNVRERPFTDIWQNSPVFERLRTMDYTGACGICEYKDICGGCRARAAYYHKGDYMASETWCTHRPSIHTQPVASQQEPIDD
jgi:putative heme d1 biosynthesis radical SAM protein NirJ2